MEHSFIPDELTTDRWYPYLIGVYLAVNAVEDVGLLMDGPECVTRKAQLLCTSHDLFSTLVTPHGRDRLVATGMTVDSAIQGDEGLPSRLGGMLLERADIAGLLLASHGLAELLGVDHGPVASMLSQASNKPVGVVPRGALRGDWLDGFGRTLLALAKLVPLAPSSSPGERPEIAVIGYPMDRNEADHLAGVREIERLVTGIGCTPTVVWPRGSGLMELRAARGASLVVSLPHGRRAARYVARAIDAPVVETDLPIGLQGTRRWLEIISRAAGTTTTMESFVEREIGSLARLMAPLVGPFLAGTHVAVATDPHLSLGLIEWLGELGMVTRCYLSSAAPHHETSLVETLEARAIAHTHGAYTQSVETLWSEVRATSPPIALLLGHPRAPLPQSPPRVGVGFPSHDDHAVYPRPMVGFAGALSLVDRLARLRMRS